MTAAPAISRPTVVDLEAGLDAVTRSDLGHTAQPGDAQRTSALDAYCQLYGYQADGYDDLRAQATAAHLNECDNPDGCDNPAHEEN